MPNTHPTIELYKNIVDSIVTSAELRDEAMTKLKQAIEDPQSFYNADREFILSGRGLSYPEDVELTSKFVLIDMLIENNQMIEIDWKEAEEEIRLQLNEVLKAKNYGFQLSKNNLYEDNIDTYEILFSINDEELEPLGYAIEMLDIDSDSYVLTVIPLNIQEKANGLFENIK
ncbi:hypothetical protein MTX78_11940 [Hymenobacter tibetensis]|uniref:DUF6630 domain-containing protein n=1 Tax=Hymenobacter tibetensis TaxID=497967 RepID=A0ABY4CRI1_9BACT|nr:hypothetical protein [Hymenobacter tibetensis]UOG72838.1 hypothetical protein MTX78_11940 [Hymenobacter tibetensis]